MPPSKRRLSSNNSRWSSIDRPFLSCFKFNETKEFFFFKGGRQEDASVVLQSQGSQQSHKAGLIICLFRSHAYDASSPHLSSGSLSPSVFDVPPIRSLENFCTNTSSSIYREITSFDGLAWKTERETRERTRSKEFRMGAPSCFRCFLRL